MEIGLTGVLLCVRQLRELRGNLPLLLLESARAFALAVDKYSHPTTSAASLARGLKPRDLHNSVNLGSPTTEMRT